MNTFKKIIPFIIVAIVFGALGFFIKGAFKNGEGSIYQAPIQKDTWGWVCHGVQGCWCQDGGGNVASGPDRWRNESPEACSKPLHPAVSDTSIKVIVPATTVTTTKTAQ